MFTDVSLKSQAQVFWSWSQSVFLKYLYNEMEICANV